MSSTESRYPNGARVSIIIEYFDESTQEEVKQTMILPNVVNPIVSVEYPDLDSGWWTSGLSRALHPDMMEVAFNGEAMKAKSGYFCQTLVERQAREAVGQ